MFLLRLILLLCLFFPLSRGAAQQVFINEIHYDNIGNDAGELVEVAGPAGTDLSGYELVLYNGSGGASYGSVQLSGTIPNEAGSGFGALSFAVTGMQNGGPDGVVLVNQAGSSVVQFLSYEGSFTAVGGVADGMASVDIGVSESNNTTAIGDSLQLSGSGSMYADFSWSGPAAASPGMINAGQTFTGGGMPSITLVIAPGIVSESDGAGAAQGMIQLFPAPAQAVTIGLSLSEAGEISVPVSVTVGVSGMATFSIDALTDGVPDGAKTVTVTAVDGGGTYAEGQTVITVTDIDLAPGRNSALRIATFNVLNGVGTMGTAKFDAQRALLSRVDADVLAFQEVIAASDFADLKALLAAVGYETDAAHLATKGDGFSTDDCGDFGSNSQCVVIASRHPITEVVQIGRGVAGRNEMTRYPLFVTIDVPGTTNDPALVAVHLKAGNSTVDHFRKAVEAYRIEQFLLDRGYDGTQDNVFVLGDFNEDWDNFQPGSFFTGIDTSNPGFSDGSTFPQTYQLGADIAGANGITLNFSDFPIPAFQNVGLSVVDTRQADGDETKTYNFIGDARLDYIMASAFTRSNGNSRTEIYNSALDVSYGGIPKSGAPLAGNVSSTASDHFLVFGDYELEPLPKVSLTFSQTVVAEEVLPLSLTATLSVSTVQAMPVVFLLSGSGLTFPAMVTLPGGSASVSFQVALAAQSGAQPDASKTILASAVGYSAGYASVRVINRDPSGLVLISQYVETSSGSSPKAIEVYNNSGGEINFWGTPLVVYAYLNGTSARSQEIVVDRGVLPAGAVLVVGDIATGDYLVNEGILVNPEETPAVAASGTIFLSDTGVAVYAKRSFTFNGDDALELCLGFTIADIFGNPGTDPGTAWTGGGVSTANTNIELRSDVQTGGSGFTDPSTRFVNRAAGTSLDGFGVAPMLSDPYAVWADGFSLTGLDYPPVNDPDGDGLSNVLEFALGGNPLVGERDVLPESVVVSGFGGVEFDRRIGGGRLEMFVESSDELINWSGVPVQSGSAVGNGDGTERVVFRHTVPLSTDGRQFFRVRALIP